MSTYLVACACEIDHILSLLIVTIYICSTYIWKLLLIQWCVEIKKVYISFFYSYFYFRSVACSLRLNPPTSVFLCGARSVQGRGGVCVWGARVESGTLGTMYELFECAFFSSAFDQLLGGGDFSAFSDESRIFSVNFLRKLWFVVLRFASLTHFIERVSTRATRKRLAFVFIRFRRGACWSCTRATPLQKI